MCFIHWEELKVKCFMDTVKVYPECYVSIQVHLFLFLLHYDIKLTRSLLFLVAFFIYGGPANHRQF